MDIFAEIKRLEDELSSPATWEVRPEENREPNILAEIERLENELNPKKEPAGPISGGNATSSDLEDIYRGIENDKTRQQNLETMGDFQRGVRQGVENVQAGLYGMAGLTGSLTGSDKLKNWGVEGYKRNSEEASLYPTKTLDDIDGVGSGVDYLQGLTGSLLPTVIEAGIGSVAGGGLGYVGAKIAAKKAAQKAVAGMVAKKTLPKAAMGQIQDRLEKHLIKQSAAPIAKKAAKAGMFNAVSAMESGSNYGELLEKHGIDAPLSSLAFGSAAASLELLGGNIKLIDNFISGVASKAPGNYLKRTAKEILTNTPAEGLQEAGQEAFSILNIVANTNEELLTPDNMKRIFESGVAGAIAGAGGAPLKAIRKTTPSEVDPTKMLSDDPLEAETEIQKADEALTPDSIKAPPDAPDEIQTQDQLDALLSDGELFDMGLTGQTQLSQTDTRNYPRYADVNPFPDGKSESVTSNPEEQGVEEPQTPEQFERHLQEQEQPKGLFDDEQRQRYDAGEWADHAVSRHKDMEQAQAEANSQNQFDQHMGNNEETRVIQRGDEIVVQVRKKPLVEPVEEVSSDIDLDEVLGEEDGKQVEDIVPPESEKVASEQVAETDEVEPEDNGFVDFSDTPQNSTPTELKGGEAYTIKQVSDLAAATAGNRAASRVKHGGSASPVASQISGFLNDLHTKTLLLKNGKVSEQEAFRTAFNELRKKDSFAAEQALSLFREHMPQGEVDEVKNLTSSQENLSFQPNQQITWQNKKGKSFPGTLLKKHGGGYWTVQKADGKNTLVNESDMRVDNTSPASEDAKQPSVSDIRKTIGGNNTKVLGEDGRAYILEDLAAGIYKAGMSLKEFAGKVATRLGSAYHKVKDAVIRAYHTINNHLDTFTLGHQVGAVDVDYRGEHTAPGNDGYSKPLHDMTDIYPDDIYSSNGARYYGDGSPFDQESISILSSLKGNPNKKVKVYRAVPKVLSTQDQIDEYESHKAYILKHGKLPPSVTNWSDKSEYYDYIWDEVNRLEKLNDTKPVEKHKINAGDWVTINRKYAVEHGKAHLDNKYRIISKTIKAKELFTDGNSIHEQGYDPSGSKFSTSTDRTPGKGLSLNQIKSQYPGQKITTDGETLSIRFKNGKGVKIKTVERFSDKEHRLAIETGRMMKDGRILGKYKNGVITLDENLADFETAVHENGHLLKDLGILNKMDLAVINNHHKKLVETGKYRYDVLEDLEENQMNTLAQMIADRKSYREKSAMNRVVQKVMDFFNGFMDIARAVLQKPIRDPEKANQRKIDALAREYESGEIYSRPLTKGKAGSKKYSVTSKKGKGDISTESTPVMPDGGKYLSLDGTPQDYPTLFYHGTQHDKLFGEGAPMRRVNAMPGEIESNKLYWFTSDPHQAVSYANGNGVMAQQRFLYPGGRIHESVVSVKNPHIVDMSRERLTPKEKEWTFSFEDGSRATEIGFRKEQEVRKAKQNGNDAVVFLNAVDGSMTNKGTIVGVFDHEDIEVRNTVEAKEETIEPYPNPTSAPGKGAQYSVASDRAGAISEPELSTLKQIIPGVKKVFAARKDKGKNYKQDINAIDTSLGLISHYSDKVPGLKKTFEALLKRPEYKYQKENDLSKAPDGTSYITEVEDLKKANKISYTRLKQYLLNRDINQIGGLAKQAGEKWNVLGLKNKKTGKRATLKKGLESKREAQEWLVDHEVSEYTNKEGKAALKAFRTAMLNLHDFYAEGWEQIESEYKKRGLAVPNVVIQTPSGEARVSLKVALAKMGDRSAYYFPRQRNTGDWRVIGKKAGEHDFIDYRANNFTAKYLAGQLEDKGYKTELEKVGRTSEDIYQSIKDILSTQAMVNQALAEIKVKDKKAVLGEDGISAEWIDKDYVIKNGGAYDWSAGVLDQIGGEPFSYVKGREYSPSYRFKNAPKNIEDIVVNSLLEAKGGSKDITFELAQALTKQLADELHSRGSRARMISRSEAIGIDVPIGYETDPVKAMAQAVNSAAGGYAKQQVAANTTKAITGRHFSWEEFQGQHDKFSEMQDLEDQLDGLNGNTKAENARLDKIKSQIKTLQQERVGTSTETETGKRRRLYELGKLYDEAEKIRKWKDPKKAASIKLSLAKLRGEIHGEYQDYIRENMIHPKRQKNAHSDAVNAVENVLRNEETSDRVIGTLRGLASVWFLGGRVSSAAINLTAMGTTVPAAMKSYGDIPLHKTAKHIAKASKAYMSMNTGAGSVSKEDRSILEEIESRGWVAAQLNMEAINALKSGPNLFYGKVAEFLMTPFKITEEFNRGVTILAAYKGVKQANPKLSREEALQKAKKISDRAHGIYGVENQPALLRKGRGLNALSSVYIFQTFFHNYLTTMVQMMGRKQAIASTYMLLSPVIFGGLGATLATPALKAIMKAVDADDPEEKIYQTFEDIFGSSDILRYGLPGLAGVNFKGSLAPNLPDFNGPIDMLGPIGGMAQNVWDGGKFILGGDIYKGIEKASPMFVGSAMKGYREATDGVTTKGGAPVFFGTEPVKGDAGTALLKLAGFNPTKTSKPREIQWNETKTRQAYQDRKKKILDRIVKYHLGGKVKDPLEWQEIIVDIRKLNARIRSNDLTRYIPLITSKTIKNKLKRASRPRKSERTR